MPKKIGSLTLFSIDDLHESLGLSKMTLRAYLRDGKLKGRKLGVQWFVTEDALREYFEESSPEEETPKRITKTYLIQGVNDLVSESATCESVEETLEVLQEQAILSLFQVKIMNAETKEVLELLKARDFLERYQS
ncbi:MAG: DNA-binding protein [Bacteroidetes bacterium]|nr:DNA-binding protein [Bacteroidota bacterium]